MRATRSPIPTPSEGTHANRRMARGKLIEIALWETEDALKATEESANQLRDASAQTASAQVANVERFEVVFDERM